MKVLENKEYMCTVKEKLKEIKQSYKNLNPKLIID